MIVVCGEALIDLVPRSIDGEDGFVPRGGGSPYNIGIGLARLGVSTGYLGRLSRDPFGRRLRARLEANGVDLRFTLEGPEPTTVAIVHLAPGEEPGYVFYGHEAADVLLSPDELPATLPDEVSVLHFGSISLVREPGASTYEGLMEREHGRRVLSLDPNVRPGLIADHDAYVRRLERWVTQVNLVKLSRADLGWLYPGRSAEDLARDWLDRGAGLVAFTLGADGALGFGAAGRIVAPSMPVTVADTVGAGDAFTAGLLAWLKGHGWLRRDVLRRLPATAIRDALEHANRVAGLTCTRSGAEPPTSWELIAWTDAS